MKSKNSQFTGKEDIWQLKLTLLMVFQIKRNIVQLELKELQFT